MKLKPEPSGTREETLHEKSDLIWFEVIRNNSINNVIRLCSRHSPNMVVSLVLLLLLLLLFLTFSALVANPKKTTLHGGQSRSWSALMKPAGTAAVAQSSL